MQPADERIPMKQTHFIKLHEKTILKLPFYGPSTKRIYIISSYCGEEFDRTIFIQRKDAFATNLITEIRNIRDHEILEIRYSCGTDGIVRIYLNEEGKLEGEYICMHQSSLDKFKEKLRARDEFEGGLDV